jgi:arylsulfatase A-like enzyme
MSRHTSRADIMKSTTHDSRTLQDNSIGHMRIRLLAIFILTIVSSVAVAAEPKPVNVLFIAIDDLRVHYGPYEIDKSLTPNIDSLASSGVAFTRAYSNVPVCGASRASMLTGVRPTVNRFTAFEAASEQTPWATSLPGHFKANGYYSISLGKIFNNPDDMAESWSEPEWRPNKAGSRPGVTNNDIIMTRHNYVTEEALEVARTGRTAHLAYEKADVEDDAYYNGQITNRAIADLNRLKEMDQPFFLAVGLVKPHLPFNAPARYWDMYDIEDIQLTATPQMPENAPKQAQHNWGELRNYGHYGRMPKKNSDELMPDDLARELIHGYYAATSYSDALVGRMLEELDKLGLSDNTIVVIWGDHGWSLGEHTQWAKHSSFNVANHIPLIVSAPGIPESSRGSMANGLVESVDIYPTLTELAKLSTPDHVQGESFRGLLDNPGKAGKPAVFLRWKNADSIRTEQYFYTEWRDKKGRVVANMLYDHDKDPSETVNLADERDYAVAVKELSRELAAHINSLEGEAQ